MPIFDYLCSHCGHKQEVMRKVGAPSVEACPKCGHEAFAKQLSAPSFQLNGTGWYATDFKGKKTESKTSTEAPSASESSAPACGAGCGCH